MDLAITLLDSLVNHLYIQNRALRAYNQPDDPGLQLVLDGLGAAEKSCTSEHACNN